MLASDSILSPFGLFAVDWASDGGAGSGVVGGGGLFTVLTEYVLSVGIAVPITGAEVLAVTGVGLVIVGLGSAIKFVGLKFASE